ncbi:amidohydrolase family protein [Streptomyces sp. NPDC059166]|uniref:amidohydrolase family protein n=1 Tax=Streptomyces sp. NPDC059166 TaxID=3346752 RepID=UPI0036B71FDB
MPDSPSDAPSLLLSGARLTDGRTVDVRISGPRIEAVGTAGSLTTRGTRLDLRGHLLLPAPVEPHAHLDTALTGAADGPPPQRPEDVRRRVTEAALLQTAHGATALRTHVRVGDAQGLGRLDGVLGAARSLTGLTELTVVAVPGPLTGRAGADGLALLREALDRGAAVIGGDPDRDPDPTGHAEAALGLAAARGLPADLHTDGTDTVRLARLASMAGELRTEVALGPCTGLSLLPGDEAARAAERLSAAAVTVICLPQGGCSGTPLRGSPPVRLLSAAGVRVAAGGGALRDGFNPVGRGDPLEAAYLLASQCGLAPEDAYESVSTSARAALGLPATHVQAGFPAELLAVRGDGLPGALSLAYSRIVVHRGRVVARTSAVREYRDSGAAAAALDLPRQGRADSGPGGGP